MSSSIGKTNVYRRLRLLGSTVVVILGMLEALSALGVLKVLAPPVSLVVSENSSAILGFLIIMVTAFSAYSLWRRMMVTRTKQYDDALRRYRDAERLYSFAQYVPNVQVLKDANIDCNEALKLIEKSSQPRSLLIEQPYKIKMKALCHKLLYEIDARIGNEKTKKTELDITLKLLESAARNYEIKKDDAKNAAQCYRLMGQLNRREENGSAAQECFTKALQLFQRDSQYWETASCYKEIAGLSTDLKGKEENLLRAANEYENDRNLWESAIAYRHLGHLFRQNDQLDKACLYFERAAERFHEDIYFWEAAESFQAVAEMLKKENKIAEARESFLKAHEWFKTAGDTSKARDALREANLLISDNNTEPTRLKRRDSRSTDNAKP